MTSAVVPDVSVVIVTFNSSEFVSECLAAVPSNTGVSFDIVVIDNASKDDTAAHVSAHHPKVSLIELDRNVGFSRAVNKGIEHTTGRNVLLLNPDAVVQPGALDRLVAFLDNEATAGVAAPSLLNVDGTDQRTARSFPTPAAAVFGRRSPLTKWWPNNRFSARYLSSRAASSTGGAGSAFRVDWVSGACLMVPRRIIDQVGPLDTRYFMYWEDADWCRRIGARGYGVYCVPDAVAVHAEGSCRRGWPAAQLKHFHRSAYHYYAQHHLHGPRAVARPAAAALMAARAGALMAAGQVRARADRRTTYIAKAAGTPMDTASGYRQ
jgi:GT2 family glycosyltransferase